MTTTPRSIKYLGAALIVTFVLLMATAYFNWKNDYSGSIVSQEMFDRCARYLTQQKYIAGPPRFTEVLLKLALIKASPPPDIAILATSRMLYVHGDFFKGQRLLNLWNGGSKLRNYMGFLGALAYHQGTIPKTVIMDMDISLFNDHGREESEDEWMMMPFYTEYLSRLASGKPPYSWFDKFRVYMQEVPVQKLDQLIDPRITVHNLSSWIKTRGARNQLGNEIVILDQAPDHCTVDAKYPFCQVLYPDGSSRILPDDGGKTPAQVAEEFQTKKTMLGVEDYATSPALLESFKTIINFLKKRNTNIYFYFPPTYPLAYDRIFNDNTGRYRVAKEVQKQIIAFANQNRIPIIGSYNPSDFNLNISDFRDDMHLREVAGRKVFETFLFTHHVE